MEAFKHLRKLTVSNSSPYHSLRYIKVESGKAVASDSKIWAELACDEADGYYDKEGAFVGSLDTLKYPKITQDFFNRKGTTVSVRELLTRDRIPLYPSRPKGVKVVLLNNSTGVRVKDLAFARQLGFDVLTLDSESSSLHGSIGDTKIVITTFKG